jgi:hypothetical protein
MMQEPVTRSNRQIRDGLRFCNTLLHARCVLRRDFHPAS